MKISIAYASDNNYIEQTAISMLSVMENNRDHQIIFYLISDEIEAENISRLEKLVSKYGNLLIVKNIEQCFEQYEISTDGDRHPKTIYAKIFLPDICEEERILYIDSDTFVKAALDELWQMDLTGIYVAGVKMPYTDRIKSKLDMAKENPYICDGVLLLNLTEWRENCVRQRCISYIKEKNGKPYMMSEGTINHVSRGHVKVLHPKYNFMSSMIMWNAGQLKQMFCADDYYSEQMIREANEAPVIIHYINEIYVRPWYKNSDHPYRRLYVEAKERLGIERKMVREKMAWRTKLLKMMNRILPFSIFVKIYHQIKKRETL